jgi:hypothetical protein
MNEFDWLLRVHQPCSGPQRSNFGQPLRLPWPQSEAHAKNVRLVHLRTRNPLVLAALIPMHSTIEHPLIFEQPVFIVRSVRSLETDPILGSRIFANPRLGCACDMLFNRASAAATRLGGAAAITLAIRSTVTTLTPDCKFALVLTLQACVSLDVSGLSPFARCLLEHGPRSLWRQRFFPYLQRRC